MPLSSFAILDNVVINDEVFPVIVDPHTHVWINDPKFPWPIENENPPKEDRTAEMLLELMSAHGVDKTVLVQVIHYRWDNSYAAQAAQRFPDKFMAVGRINPEDPDAPDHLSMWTEDYGVHGVRLSPAVEGTGDWFAGSLMPPIFTRAQKLGVPLLLLTRPPRLLDLIPLLESHGDLDVVIDHMADVHPDDVKGRATLLDLARFPRVYVKISHTWSISKEEYPWRDTHGLVEDVYQAFGPERIMWGTDWPVCLGNAEYDQTLSVVRDAMKFISPADLEWVLGKTALKLWSFDSV